MIDLFSRDADVGGGGVFGPPTGEGPERIGLFITPEFSLMAVLALFEPLRVANKVSGSPLFDCRVVSEKGGVVLAANGLGLQSHGSIADHPALPSVIVCSSYNPHLYETRPAIAWLRRLARQKSALGAIDTGCHMLARAGLLDGYRVTMHWEVIPSFTEEFPQVVVTDSLFEVDRDRFTCAGGSAGYDMMLQMIAIKHGRDLAVAVAEQFVQNRIRAGSEPQRLALPLRVGTNNGLVLEVVETMQATLEDPLTAEDLARSAGVSSRQLGRLFASELGTSPMEYYLRLRLRRARELLQQSSMDIMNIAVSCGFQSAAHFSRSYRRQFGRSPREDRRQKTYFELA